MLIKLINQPKDYPFLDIAGLSSKQYRFAWDSKIGFYVFAPRCQEDIDDLMQSQNDYASFFFSVVLEGNEIPKSQQFDPAVPRSFYINEPDTTLRALASDCGLRTQEKDDRKTLIRLIDAYYLGLGVRKSGVVLEPKKRGRAKKKTEAEVPELVET